VFKKIQRWFRHRRFREGKTLSRFIARDVRREVQIVSAVGIDEGFVIARVRTSNVLYVSRGLAARPEFEPAREMRIDEMWKWTGKSWGGLPDGTSIVEHLRGGQSLKAPKWGEHKLFLFVVAMVPFMVGVPLLLIFYVVHKLAQIH